MNWYKNLGVVKDLLKRSPEIIEQIVYDVNYKRDCPLCHIEVSKSIHRTELPSYASIPEVYFENSVVMECSNCHVALFGERMRIVKTLKKYTKGDGILGLKLISEEIIP